MPGGTGSVCYALVLDMADSQDAPFKPNSSEESYPKLISLAVHEFRTPASVVGGYLRMLQRDEDPMSDRQRKMIDEAAKSCARLVEIVSELSEVGKLDSGLSPLAREPLDFFSILEALAASVHEAGGREVRLQVRGPATGAFLTGDPIRLRSAMSAIIRAILREQPADVTVVAERLIDNRDGHSLGVVVVADERIVSEAYARRPMAFDEKRGGLGLALPIARRVVEAHGGHVWSPAVTNQTSEEAARGAAIVALPLEQNR